MTVATREEFQAATALAMSEATLQSRVVRDARSLGFLAYHTRDSRGSDRGWPDLVLAHPAWGLLLVRELKSQKGRVRPEQRAWLNALTALGVDAGIWRPSDLLDGTVHRELTARRTRPTHEETSTR